MSARSFVSCRDTEGTISRRQRLATPGARMNEKQKRTAITAALLAGVIALLLTRLSESVAGPPLYVTGMSLCWFGIGIPGSGAKNLDARQGQIAFGVLGLAGAVA